jgi:hypothetical protein
MKNSKKRQDLLRLESILEKDRLSVGKEYVDLIASDVYKLLLDYMELDKEVNVAIKKGDKDFSVTITTTAKRLKTFLSPLKE